MALARLAEALMSRDYLERFIHIGTSELYGSVDRPVSEDAPLQPTSPYAASKAAFDMHLIAIHRVLKFPMNILRPSNAYGPGQLLHRVIPKAVVCGLTGQKLPLHGGGRAEKSYIHARDLARAIHLVARAAPLGTVYNAGPPEAVKAKLLVVVAMQDHMVNPAPAEQFARATKSELLTLTGDCGHLATTCEKEKLIGAVTRFLATP